MTAPTTDQLEHFTLPEEDCRLLSPEIVCINNLKLTDPGNTPRPSTINVRWKHNTRGLPEQFKVVFYGILRWPGLKTVAYHCEPIEQKFDGAHIIIEYDAECRCAMGYLVWPIDFSRFIARVNPWENGGVN